MSLNFPTAFWKTDVDPSVSGVSLSWESALWWSHGEGEYDYDNGTYDNFVFQYDLPNGCFYNDETSKTDWVALFTYEK